MVTRANKASKAAEQMQAVVTQKQAAGTFSRLFPDAARALDIKKLKRLNMPRMIKPDEFPIGAAVQAQVVRVVPSLKQSVKGQLLWLEANGQEFLFPCSGTIRSALAPGLSNDDGKELTAALERFIGKTLVIRRDVDGVTKNHKDDSGRAKRMFMFEVFEV